jgi:hypothetical protein
MGPTSFHCILWVIRETKAPSFVEVGNQCFHQGDDQFRTVAARLSLFVSSLADAVLHILRLPQSEVLYLEFAAAQTQK